MADDRSNVRSGRDLGTPGKRPELKRISRQEKLPVLALPDGTTISGAGSIVARAKDPPAA